MQITCILTRTHIRAHARTHIHTNARTHTYTRTHERTYTRPQTKHKALKLSISSFEEYVRQVGHKLSTLSSTLHPLSHIHLSLHTPKPSHKHRQTPLQTQTLRQDHNVDKISSNTTHRTHAEFFVALGRLRRHRRSSQHAQTHRCTHTRTRTHTRTHTRWRSFVVPVLVGRRVHTPPEIAHHAYPQSRSAFLRGRQRQPRTSRQHAQYFGRSRRRRRCGWRARQAAIFFSCFECGPQQSPRPRILGESL